MLDMYQLKIFVTIGYIPLIMHNFPWKSYALCTLRVMHYINSVFLPPTRGRQKSTHYKRLCIIWRMYYERFYCIYISEHMYVATWWKSTGFFNTTSSRFSISNNLYGGIHSEKMGIPEIYDYRQAYPGSLDETA